MKIGMSSVILRPAKFSEQYKIYQWLACSDATPEMLGPPCFPDAPIPNYKEFCDDYNDEAFSQGGNFRLYVIVADNNDIGALSYYLKDQVAEFDLWIASRLNWHKGWGSQALKEGIKIVSQMMHAEIAIIRPSGRNYRAIAAYQKAGFKLFDPSLHSLPLWCLTDGKDYEDAVVLFQNLN